MLQHVVLAVFAPVLVLLLVALALTVLSGCRAAALRAGFARFRRLPVLGQIFVTVFVVGLVVHGSTKDGGTDGRSAGTSGRRLAGTGTSGEPQDVFSPDEVAAGFTLRRLRAGATDAFEPPAQAVVHAPWRLRGAHADHFAIASGTNAPWCFPFGTDLVRRVTVSAQGAVLLHGETAQDAAAERRALRDLDAGAAVGASSRLMAPLRTALGMLPEAQEGELPVTARPSRFWHAVTPEGGLLLTWQNAALGRNAAAPVSVQAELKPCGAFVYRYLLPSAPAALYGTNLLIGAWNAGHGESLASNRAEIAVADLLDFAGRAAELEWHPLDPLDAEIPDRDGDGLSTRDELFVHGTSPACFDTDGDGLGDGEEIRLGLDPLVRDSDGDGLVDGADPDPAVASSPADLDGDGLPDVYERHWFGDTNVHDDVQLRDVTGFTLATKLACGMNPTNAPAAEVAVTNRLVAYKLWDGFRAPWPSGVTNLVYERTLRIDRVNNWRQYFLSSAPDRAGGWSLGGLSLEWEDDRGARGSADASPFGDSLRLPLSTERPATVTIRLRARDAEIRSATPVYLLAYAPEIRVLGGQTVELADGTEAYVFVHGSESEIGIEVDRSARPCRAELDAEEQAVDGLDAMALNGGAFVYEGDCRGGRIQAKTPGIFHLPVNRVEPESAPSPRRSAGRSTSPGGTMKVFVLSPYVGYSGGSHCEDAERVFWDEQEQHYTLSQGYPLDAACTWQNWWRPSHQGYTCSCAVMASSGIAEDEDVDVEILGEHAKIQVGGQEVWSGEAVHGKSWQCGGVTLDLRKFLSTLDECDSCMAGCVDGKCDSLENVKLNSLKFRIPLGMPEARRVAGFVYMTTDGPVRIGTETFRYLFHDAETNLIVTTESATERHVVYSGTRGRDLRIASTNDGVVVTIRTTATGVLEHSWTIVNPEGDDRQVRLRKISRQNNVMEDWTYSCEPDERGGWIWTAVDNIARVSETLAREDGLNDPDVRRLVEVRTKRDVQGNLLGSVRTESMLVGEGDNAVLREVLREENTGRNIRRREAAYWRDDVAANRNGCVRLVQGNDTAWQYYDWDVAGREVLRLEQWNGSPVPVAFPRKEGAALMEVDAGLEALATVLDYALPDGDSGHVGDAARPRSEIRYAIREGEVRCIGRTHRRLRRVTIEGRPCIREETWRAADAVAEPWSDAGAFSFRTVVDDLGLGVSGVMGGQLVESLDEDGVRTACTFAETNGVIVRTTRTYRGALAFPTYLVEELDAAHGTVLRRTVRLADDGTAIGDEASVYDEKNRLRSTSYADGTSLTNAYSCCRLLWSQDRAGRRRLRSGRTGQDHLYHAEEEVWMQDINTNGYKVTQHFLDALGRETNTVVYVGTTPGEADDWTASEGHRTTSETVSYPVGGNDHRVSCDARGRTTVTTRDTFPDREETHETVLLNNGAAELETTTVQVRNGSRRTRRAWDGVWTEQIEETSYDDCGRRIVRDITASSDYGVVTNATTVYDWLGRSIQRTTPLGTTVCSYVGASSRRTHEVTTSAGVCRTLEMLHDTFGRQVGTRQDGITRREEEDYGWQDGAWWRITRRSVVGDMTNAVAETREQLTGLSNSCRARTITVSTAGVVTERVRAYDAASRRETETTTSSVQTPRTETSLHGVVLTSTTSKGTVYATYDELGRVVHTDRSMGAAVARVPVRTDVRNAFGDVVETCVYTNATAGVTTYAAYDDSGRRIVETNALGVVSETAYDVFGRIVSESGTGYPVRYTYDTEGRRLSLATTRDGTVWDVTRWNFDPATGNCTEKRYPDGSSETYVYTSDGLLLQTTHPSGKVEANLYDARRRRVAVTVNGGTHEAVFTLDALGRQKRESTAAALSVYVYGPCDIVTNEIVTVGSNDFSLVRTPDAFCRIAGRGLAGGAWQQIAYTAENRVGTVSTTNVTATYAYDGEGNETGYVLAVAGGATFERRVTRDPYRPEIVTSVTNYVNGVAVGGFAYAHDALSRVVRRNADAFIRNARGEVVSAEIQGEVAAYGYDAVGNWTQVVRGPESRVFTANTLNQYVSCTAAGVTETPQHTADGACAGWGDTAYGYDVMGRLAVVSTNGVEVRCYAYDARGRLVQSEASEGTRTFVYDGWNLVYEELVRPDGARDVVRYYWGRDISGTLDAGGGVGGLLYLTCNGALYVPLYDANGNIVAYCSAQGNAVATFAYDAFGGTLTAEGNMAESFRLRFSTKWTEPATGLVYYGRRFYRPDLGRWLTRDPLGEQGGVNLFGFCGNDAVGRWDLLGESWLDPRRAKWDLFAQWYFMPRGDTASAHLLRHSLQDHPEDLFFNGAHFITQKIQASPEYRVARDKWRKALPAGFSVVHEHDDTLAFTTGDLSTAIGKARLEFAGYVCKQFDGRFSGRVEAVVSDRYDFDWWDIVEKSRIREFDVMDVINSRRLSEENKSVLKSLAVTIGNNKAWWDQEVLGLIVPYNWVSSFLEVE